MTSSDIPLAEGSLASELERRTRSAIESGALRGVDTEQRVVADGGVRFLVRAVSRLKHKARPKPKPPSAKAKDVNPFLSPEPDLTVGYLSDSHIAVLNKFNVLERHLLIITRDFEHQECLLTPADFAALVRCLREIDGLGFYNGGPQAGASQSHKHLQLVPLPLSAGEAGVPMEALFPSDSKAEMPTTIAQLPFDHRFAPLSEQQWRDSNFLHRLYRDMLKQCGINEANGRQSSPYNLLLRRGWLLLVPRSREHVGGISINALGYAGSLFVRHPDEMAAVTWQGPMRILRAVGRPVQASTTISGT